MNMKHYAVLEWKVDGVRSLHVMAKPTDQSMNRETTFRVIGESFFGTKREARIALAPHMEPQNA